jgi:hypothetical protein
MSAALDHPLDRLVGVEILPGVLDAMPHFAEHNSGLGRDARARIATGDGRVYLRTSAERFDVIISDLFVPWHAGTGSLYTLEHFRAGRGRLNPGGLFVQWLPLYQMSERELGSIAATFAAVFPHVSIWRGDFSTTAPIIGLAGSVEPLAIDEAALGARLARLAERITPPDPILQTVSDFTLLYAGDLASVRSWVARFRVNTDDSPVIEFMAPIGQARKQMMRGPALLAFYRRVQESPAVNPVRVRPIQGGDPAALSPLAGNLLFVAMEAAAKQDTKNQFAAIQKAAEFHPGSNVLSLLNVVLSTTSSTATRGVTLESLQ